MTHLTIDHIEKAFASGEHEHRGGYLYVETGMYKPYMPSTVVAARRRGYRVERKVQGVYYIYPKSSAPVVAPETYEGKVTIVHFFERRGIRYEREGNNLYGMRPMFYQAADGVWHTNYERIEVRTMSEARALDKLIDA